MSRFVCCAGWSCDPSGRGILLALPSASHWAIDCRPFGPRENVEFREVFAKFATDSRSGLLCRLVLGPFRPRDSGCLYPALRAGLTIVDHSGLREMSNVAGEIAYAIYGGRRGSPAAAGVFGVSNVECSDLGNVKFEGACKSREVGQ